MGTLEGKEHWMRQPQLVRIIVALMLTSVIACTPYTQQRPRAADGDQAADACQDAACNVVAGFSGNAAAVEVTGATISGGGQKSFPNQVTGDFGAIGGGLRNEAFRDATVSGGSGNVADLFRATVGGGGDNIAHGENATVSGGLGNRALGLQATISGGFGNMTTEMDTTIGGGAGNRVAGRRATVGGGSQNTATGYDSVVAGGTRNTAGSTFAAVAGGLGNTASGMRATVAGGAGNAASGANAAIGGGLSNRATDDFSTVAGGWANIAGNANADPQDARYATVGGGLDNAASGSFSTVPGGQLNAAASAYSFAAGHRAHVDAAHPGAFVYADAGDLDFSSDRANEFAVRATGGVRFVTAIDAAGDAVAGVRLTPGSSAWSTLSDRDAKVNVAPVDDTAQILELLAQLPVSTWNYADQAGSTRHIGPTGQAFYAAFGLGEDDGYISTVDADGVALAAIQGLYQLLQEQDAQIAAQAQRLAVLEARLATLEQTINRR